MRANRAIGDAARGKVDVNCAQALPKDLGDWKSTVDFVLGPYNCATDLNEISSMDLARAADRDNNAFCRQGFGALLAGQAANIPVQLSTPVTQIDTRSSSGGVEVRTAKGTLRGRFVIVTASTGVLSGGKIAFAPELPKRQLDALAKLKMGSFDHVALEFSGNPLGLQRDDLVFEKSANTQTGALARQHRRHVACHGQRRGEVRPRAVGQGRQGNGRFRDRLAHRPLWRRHPQGREAHRMRRAGTLRRSCWARSRRRGRAARWPAGP